MFDFQNFSLLKKNLGKRGFNDEASQFLRGRRDNHLLRGRRSDESQGQLDETMDDQVSFCETQCESKTN